MYFSQFLLLIYQCSQSKYLNSDLSLFCLAIWIFLFRYLNLIFKCQYQFLHLVNVFTLMIDDFEVILEVLINWELASLDEASWLYFGVNQAVVIIFVLIFIPISSIINRIRLIRLKTFLNGFIFILPIFFINYFLLLLNVVSIIRNAQSSQSRQNWVVKLIHIMILIIINLALNIF